MAAFVLMIFILNPFHATGLSLSRSLSLSLSLSLSFIQPIHQNTCFSRFSDVFKWYRKRPVASNWFKKAIYFSQLSYLCCAKVI